MFNIILIFRIIIIIIIINFELIFEISIEIYYKYIFYLLLRIL